jgi:hypothetical protein
MNEQEQIDALMKLSEFRFARWRERRTYEWKMSLALWAVLVGGLGYLKVNSIQLSGWLIGPLLLALVIGHALFWVRTNWLSAQVDIKNAFHFAETAEKIVLPLSPIDVEKRWKPKDFNNCNAGGFRSWSEIKKLGRFLDYPACLAQVLATAFFALTLFLVLVCAH